MPDILVNKIPVELFKLLKFEGLAQSGAAAKTLIDDNQVYVNDLIETRRRRKLIHGDVVRVAEVEMHIVYAKKEVDDELE